MKKVKWCHYFHIKKNGRLGKRQLYKRLDCGRQFVGRQRADNEAIITDFIDGKLTLRQLSEKYSLSVRTIREQLKGMRHVHVILKYRNVVINMDTTYWSRHFGLMIIKDTFRNRMVTRMGAGYTASSATTCAPVSDIENIPVTDVPVPYDSDCPKTSDGKAESGSIRRTVGNQCCDNRGG